QNSQNSQNSQNFQNYNNLLFTFPVAPIGSDSRNSTWRGDLYAASCSLLHAISASAVKRAPGPSTTHAFTPSPPRSSFTPTTAASATAGCVISTSSTSRGYTFIPPRSTTSFLRSTMVRYPSASNTPTSPVRSQPPRSASAVSAGRL